MRRSITPVLGAVALLALLSPLAVRSLSAQGLPPAPLFLEGSVTVGGQPAADGVLVTAQVQGVPASAVQCSTVSGRHGSNPCPETGRVHLRVPGDNPDTAAVDGGKSGDTVEIAVGGTVVATTTFASGVIEIVDLSGATLAFTTHPSASSKAGLPFDVQPQVTIQDGQSNTITDTTAPVTLAVTSETGTAGASLLGTTTVQAVGGVASFSELSIDTVGNGYTLVATASGHVSATSTALSVVPNPIPALTRWGLAVVAGALLSVGAWAHLRPRRRGASART
jgi:hypothetical protein